jgi:hypothetical protein
VRKERTTCTLWGSRRIGYLSSDYCCSRRRRSSSRDSYSQGKEEEERLLE